MAAAAPNNRNRDGFLLRLNPVLVYSKESLALWIMLGVL